MPNTITKKTKANTIFFPLKLKHALFVFASFQAKFQEGEMVAIFCSQENFELAP
mgnify:CR=1 FL=1